MRPLTEPEIRTCFINGSRGDAKRMSLPRDLADRPWDDLDFLGWIDPSAPDRGYLVTEHGGSLVGVALRRSINRPGTRRSSMCSLCLTNHPGSGVALMAAPKAGPSGRQGNTVGIYVCADLACSLYIRGHKHPQPGAYFEETLTVDERIARTRERLSAFLDSL